MKLEHMKYCVYFIGICVIMASFKATPLYAQSGLFDKCCTDVKACCKGNECDCSSPRCSMTMNLENDRRVGRGEGPFILLHCRKKNKS